MKPSPPRILCVLKLLQEHSDETHPLSISDLIRLLRTEYGVEAHRATLYGDIEQLSKFGIDVICTRSTQNRYFIGARTFEVPELRLLIDAISSSKCLTPKKSQELIDKLMTLVSKPQADLLYKHCAPVAVSKPKNENIYYIIDVINSAIAKKQAIRFYYTEYTAQKELVLRGDGEAYTLSPYACVWSGDYYYCIGWHDKRQDIAVFRVDRIAGIPEIADEAAVPPPEDFDLNTYTAGVFQMFIGEPTEVTLLCDNGVMKSVIDKFSEDVETEIADEEHVLVKTTASLSPTFYGWIFEFAGRIRIVSPEHAKNELKAMVGRLQETL